MPDAVDSGRDVPAPAPPFSRPRAKRRRVLWILLVVLLAATVWVAVSDSPLAQGIQELSGYKHDQAILENSFSVSPHNFRYYKFSLPEGSMNVAVVGQFTASNSKDVAKAQHETGKREGDKDKDADDNIEVYVLSEEEFAIWQNGYATNSVYESGRTSQGRVQATLPAGAGIYYLVFSNRFSARTAKNVNASVLLRYKNWQPSWFRRIKGSLAS